VSLSDVAHGDTHTRTIVSDFEINVIGPPDAPKNVKAVPADGLVTITFDPPYDGGSSITKYTLLWSPPGGTDQQAGSDATTRVVKSLSNGTDYTFSVTATNGVGDSAASSLAGPVKPFGLPGSPTIVGAIASDRQIVVAFTPPANNGSPISEYKLWWNPSDGRNLQEGTTATKHVLTGLTNHTLYTITVRAINAAGAGPESDMIGTTPTEVAAPRPTPTDRRATSRAVRGSPLDARDGDDRDDDDPDRRELNESVQDVVAYPLLTEQVSFPSQPGGTGVAAGASAVPAGAALGQSAAKAVGDVLGWKVNASDPKGFIGALTQSFALSDVEGHVAATWVPRTYAVQTDLGGVLSGAQASLYTRAKDALDQALPLLDGLYPLNPDADPEYVKALREMAKSQMIEIVKEFGTLGGPSVLRVNTYFGILLGQKSITFKPETKVIFDPDLVGGTLGEIRETFGIRFQGNPFSNSIEDEQDITNFRVISDYMTSLLQSWISNGRFFQLGKKQPAFFGTQLVLLSRQFSVIAETISEVRFALDSVFIGPSERQMLLLEFDDRTGLPPIFLEDMLNEIDAHVSTESPRLLQDGGRISVENNILPVLRSFQEMVGQTHRPKNLRELPKGYKTTRVQRTLEDLYVQLQDLIRLIEPIGERIAQPIEPNGELRVLSTSVNNKTLTIFGTGFERNAVVEVKAPSGIAVPVRNATVASQNLVVATLESAPDKSSGPYAVVVTNPDDEQRTVEPLMF
jgi:hypothetical protein